MAVAQFTPERIVAVDECVGFDGQPFTDRRLGRPPAAVHLRLHLAHDGSRPPPGQWELAGSLSGYGLST